MIEEKVFVMFVFVFILSYLYHTSILSVTSPERHFGPHLQEDRPFIRTASLCPNGGPNKGVPL